jgi:mannose-6-phosphate isomerase-like protein (cupin superfamily)
MTVNEVDMQPRVVRGEETIHYPTDQIHLRGVGQGNVQVVEYVSCDRDGSPRHAHECDEIDVLVEDEVEFTIGDDVTLAGPGAVQYVPAGVAHTVRLPAGEARVLMVTIGPRYDGFAREMARLFAAGAALVDIASAANRFGVTRA